MATREDCIRVATGNGLSAEDAALLVDEIGQERDRLAASGQTADMTAAIARRIMDKAEAARMKARAERRMAALNIVTHDRIQTFVNSVKAEGGFGRGRGRDRCGLRGGTGEKRAVGALEPHRQTCG